MNTPELICAAERTAHCAVSHVDSVPVVETFNGQPIWEGIVEVYQSSEPPPKFIYGWIGQGPSNEIEYVTMAGVAPINCALDAIRAWIASLAKK